jgi:hypothetical protein
VKALHLGVVIEVGASERFLIEEAQTGTRFDAKYSLGRAIASTTRSSIPQLSEAREQGKDCALKTPTVGDAVCFEVSACPGGAGHWGYVNRYLLTTERAYPSRFVPRLVG